MNSKTAIQMVDLQKQYAHIKPEVDAAIQRVIDESAFINGGEVKLFATELAQFLEVKHLIPCANGTDALQIAMMALDMPQGAEIIVPTFNYVAAVEVIAFLGFKPVFIDANPSTFNLDVSQIEEKITKQTKAIVAVHLFGQCADMDALMAIALKHNLWVIEDNAQAIGAQYTSHAGKTQFAGTIGHIGTTSFFPSKNLGCMGDGGAIYTSDDRLAEKMQMIANHGQKKKYQYEIVGINSRLDTLQASILRVKLNNLKTYIKNRQQAAAFYDQQLNGNAWFEIPPIAKNSTHVYHQYTLHCRTASFRTELQQALAQAQIPSMIYYPSPLHLQNAYTNFGYQKGQFPIAEMLCEKVLSLPMHTELDNEQLNYICNTIKEKTL